MAAPSAPPHHRLPLLPAPCKRTVRQYPARSRAKRKPLVAKEAALDSSSTGPLKRSSLFRGVTR
jgi:hypothetical protein